VVNGQSASDLLAHFGSNVEITSLSSDPQQAVRDNTVDAALVIPAGWQQAVSSNNSVSISVLYNSTRSDSALMISRVTEAVREFDDGLIQGRMAARGIDTSLLDVPAPLSQDVSTSQERGGFFLGLLLPMFLIIWAITGGMYTAIDVSAGEKERKTLEAILTTPVRRVEIVLGKLFAVSITSVATITLALATLYIALQRFGSSGLLGPQAGTDAINLTMEPSGILVMFVAGIFLAIMFGAVELSLSIFAKSYREAQSYLTPMYLVAILPIVAIDLINGFQPNLALFLVPAVNAVLLFKEVLLGTMNAGHIIVTLGSLVIYALAATAISTKIYERESVLFRT
jgi:sodium transport system permease protein